MAPLLPPGRGWESQVDEGFRRVASGPEPPFSGAQAQEWSMKQRRIEPARRTKARDPDVVEDVVADEPDAGLLADIDDLLDEIDAVLEDQAMLAEFRQRPGQ